MNEMANEPTSVWYVPAIGEGANAILLKCQTNVIKAIVQGCRVELMFGMTKNEHSSILCTGGKNI